MIDDFTLSRQTIPGWEPSYIPEEKYTKKKPSFLPAVEAARAKDPSLKGDMRFVKMPLS